MKANDVAAEARISYRQLDYWTRAGLVHAVHLRGVKDPHEADAGSGTQRQYAETEIAVVKQLAALCRLGMGPRSAAPIARRAAEELIPLDQALTEALRQVAS